MVFMVIWVLIKTRSQRCLHWAVRGHQIIVPKMTSYSQDEYFFHHTVYLQILAFTAKYYNIKEIAYNTTCSTKANIYTISVTS